MCNICWEAYPLPKISAGGGGGGEGKGGSFDYEYICHILVQSLQAPACHENMIKVGGYILGEFGNLIAGDQRSR